MRKTFGAARSWAAGQAKAVSPSPFGLERVWFYAQLAGISRLGLPQWSLFRVLMCCERAKAAKNHLTIARKGFSKLIEPAGLGRQLQWATRVRLYAQLSTPGGVVAWIRSVALQAGPT